MPARWMCLAIVAFWMTTTGWLFWKEVWPFLEPGQPPPFTIDLEEEAQPEKVQIRWAVTRNDQVALIANTWVDYREKPDDTFALNLHIIPQASAADAPVLGLAKLVRMDSTYRVTRRGELRETSFEAIYEPAVQTKRSGQIEIKVDGEVSDGKFTARLEFNSAAFSGERVLEPVPVSHHGTVLLPLHPVNRIEGLRRGQSWRMPMLNVLEASFGAGDPIIYLAAKVLPETRKLTIDEREHDCLIIEYHGGDIQASTWVDEKTGLVMRQEQTIAGDVWAMQRESRLAK